MRGWIAEVIDRQLAGMTRLVDDLLDLTRVRAGTLRLQRAQTLLTEIIDQAVETSLPAITARGQTLVVNVRAEPILLDVDALWLSHAVQNLLGNAAKYAGPQGRIEISAARDGGEAVIAVCDTGVGLAPAELERIFDLYATAHSGTERSSSGLGIGLYVARRLVEAHGGTLRAASAGHGRGAEFIMRLPAG
jgi:signal transduction histidine kinase